MKVSKFLTLAMAASVLAFASCTHKNDPVKATAITLPEAVEVSNVAPVELVATVTPSNATSNVAWVSSNPAVLSVVSSGQKTAILTAVSAGTATVTASIDGISATCAVTVTMEALYPPIDPVAGHLVWVVKFDVAVCDGYDVVFVGTPGWDGDLTRKFTAIDGWAGWYKLDIPIEGAEDGDWLISGKPVQVQQGGTFDWAYQVGWNSEADAEVLAGASGIVIEAGYDGECNIHFSSISEVIATRFVKWKNVPCVAVPTHNYTFNATVPAETADGVVRIVGDFGHAGYSSWSPAAADLIMTKVDATHYTITLNNVKEGTGYKYILNGETADWDGEELAATAEGADCANAIGNRSTPTTATVNDVVANWRNVTATRCQ